jgi:tRNA threonylcarbamoyladenosine biosynthesis protein TsaE
MSRPPPPLADLTLTSPDATASVAADLADRLRPGDVLALEGDLGAGKTHFARSLIQHLMAQAGTVEDVPSPTFTLVQTYDLPGGEVWHADLYRLSDQQEVDELGLIDAFETEICLVEWPDRLGDELPDRALRLTLTMLPAENARRLVIRTHRPDLWQDRLGALAAP